MGTLGQDDQDEANVNVTEATKDEKMDINVTGEDESPELAEDELIPDINMPFATPPQELTQIEVEHAPSEAELSEFNEDEADLISSDTDTQSSEDIEAIVLEERVAAVLRAWFRFAQEEY